MSNKNCTYTFTNGQGQKQTIMGLSSMKAFLVDGGLDLFYPSGKFPWLSTESAISIIQPGPVERRPQRIGSSRYSRVSVIPGINTQADANAQDKVVAYLNGDISRTTLMDYLSASGLPEEKIIAFTQRMQDDGPSMGEIKAMLAQRDDLDAMFDDVLAEEMAKDEAAKPAPQSKPKASKPRSTTSKPRSTAARPTRTAGQAAASAAKNTASALANAIDGLGALFGGGGKFNSGLSFDEETYAKAKPLFQAAIANLGEAGQDLREAMRAVVRMVLDKFGAQAAQNMKPYVVRFVSDVQNGNITGESNDESQVRRDGDEALEDVAPEQGGGAQGGGRVRGGDSGGSDSGDQSGRGADADGVSTTRGGRGRSKGVRASGAGAGGRGRRGSDRAGEAGPRVQRDDAGAAGDSGQGGSAGLIEPPAIPATNYRISADTRLGVGSEIEKFNDNIAAIKTLKRIESERRRATPDEQRILARYVGWGGLASAFPNPATGQFKEKWQERGELLRSLLTKQEYDKASNSTIAAHFTSETVVRSMWDIAKRLGFKGGLALEDSMGVGNFVGLMPEGLDARFIGVELDSLTARIAQALYPQATVLNSGFEQVPIADNAFALNIGNPPFSKVSLNFQFKPELAGVSMHNQFFRAGMDALRPGGLQIKVVSRYLMDAEDKSTRLALAAKARLVGLIRLPDTAFQENARTEVVTDIVILQKLSPAEQAEMDLAIEAYKSRGDKNGNKTPEQQMLASRVPAWVETALVPDPLGGEPMRVNSYLARNPRNIMGTLERSGSMQFKNDVTVRLDNPQRLGDMLAEAVARLPMNIHSLEAEVMAATEERFKSMSDALRIALANEEIGHLKVDEDGKLQRVIERETPEGGYEMQRQELTPQSPWSSQLYLDAQGRWYRLVPKLDADGNKIKEPGKDGKASNRNVYEREVFSEQDVPDGLRLGATAYARLRGMVGLRDLLKAQLVMETEDADPQSMEANRAKLSQAYEQFVAEFGPVNRSVNLNLAMTMPDGGLVAALEVSYQPERTENQAKKSGLPAQEEVAIPAPVMSKRVVPKYEPATTANSGADALAIVLSETGRVDVERIAALRGVSVEDAVAELQSGDAPLVFKDPESGQYETADNYLSGMVKRKLKAAEAAGMALNVRALQAVQPEPWTAENVTVSLGANWVPVDVYADFINHLTGGQARVNYSSATNAFGVTNRGEDRAKHEDWSSDGAPVEYLIQQALNSRSATVTYKDGDGNTKINTALTDLANLKIKEIKSEFSDWVFADAARRERLVAINNELFNTRVTRQHNGQHLKLPGKVPDAILKMRRHQLNAIWRGIYERFMLIDHAVGAGKTFTGIARAMERRRMGLSKKPMIVVPNHLVEQWAADVYRLYPGAKVLAAGKKDFEVENRRRLLGKIATGDWDIVIMPHSSFGGIGISPETERRYLEEELQLAIQAVQDAEDQAKEDGLDSGWRKPYTVKMAEALVTKIKTRMERINAGVRDRLLTFEQLGVDDLTVDEAHEFKNLYYSSNLSKVRGMGDRGGSRKANDLYNKVRVLRDSPTGSVTFMTGTPISNSAVEMYTMMRYLAADSLKEMGLENFDAWRTQFVEHTTAFEPTETGRLKEVSRLGRTWSNMRGLMELYYQFTDAVSLQDIQRWYSEDNGGKPFPVPKLKGGDRQLVKIKPTPTQNQFLSDIIDGFDGLPGIEDPNERNAERLRLMDRARKVSLDVRAIDPTNPSKEEGGKLDVASQNIKRIYDKFNTVRGTQLVFLDRSVPKSKGDDKLIKEYDALVAKREEALANDDEDAFAKVAEALEKFDSDEMESLRAAQAGGWNAYQQLKDNLVAMGIPANEIRFIQEANTDDQKLALFDAVNGGKVRVLIGSTPRMGAGTNVQKRAVALHHIDVTWKPSDIEQREGRVIRQGNLFATPPSGKEPNPFYRPDFEVEILAYATERTVDAKMWDLNATKLKTINGIRKYDGSFTMDFEDSDSVSMAEMAALASGNPLLLERVKLESEIGTLELQERAHRRKMYGAEDALGRAEDAIRNHPERINRERAKVEAAAKRVQGLQERVNARSVNVEGATYSDRYAAAKAVKESIERQQNGDENARFAVSINGKRYSGKDSTLEAVDAALGDVQPFEMTVGDKLLIQRTAAGREVAAALGQATAGMTGELTTELKLGDVLGLSLVAGVRRYLTQDGNPMLDVDISALDAIGNTIASEQLPSQVSGIIFNTTTVKNSLDRLFDSMVADSSDRRLNNLVRELQDAKDNLATYREKASEPFPGAQEIQAKRARLAEVVQLLDGSNAPVQEPAAPAPIVQRWNPGEPRFMQPAFSRGSARTSAGVNWQPAADQSAAKIVAAGMRADQRNKPGNYDYTIVEPAKTRLGLGNLAGDRAQGLTDALYRRVRDFEAAFGRRVVFVRADNGSPDGFSGFIMPKSDPDTIYVNINADINLMSILGHEFYEGLVVKNPQLHSWFLNQAARQLKDGALKSYSERLARAGDKQRHGLGRFKEMLADFAGDALADPEFRRSLEKADPSKFRALIRSFREFLIRLLSKMRGRIVGTGIMGERTLQANQHFKDVQALRDALRDVIRKADSGGNLQQFLADGGALFSRSQDQTQTEAFKRWFKQSAVVDANGDPLVVYHGGVVQDADGISIFRPGSHFGTLDQAYDAQGESYRNQRRLRPDLALYESTYPVYLSIQNPYRSRDVEDGWDDVIERAKALGHDGIVYLNKYEGDGESDSWIAFYPEQVKSVTGNNGGFDPTNPDIRFSRAMPAPNAQPSAWTEPGMTRFDNVVYKLQDKLIDTKRVQAAITKTAGEIEDDINAYQREELYHGRAAKRAQDFLTQELNPMVEQLAKNKIELADFEEYLHARHAPEANRVLAERNPNQAMIDAGLEAATQEIEEVELELASTTDPAEIKLLSRRMREAQADLSKWSSVQPFRGTEEDRLRLSGMSDDQARAIMDALTPEQRAKLDAAAAQFDAIVAQNRQLMVDYDLEDQETIDSWSQLFQHYVPLMREDEGDGVQQGMGTGQGFSIKGREVKSRTGSTRKVVDIVANVAMQRERIITRGEKNRVSQALMGLAALNPNPDFWKLGAPDKKRQYDPATNTVKVVTDPQYKNRENVVVAKVRNSKGRVTEVALTFNERDARAVRMAAAIKNLEDSQLGTVMSWTAKITRYMASINTQYNPIFGVVNLVRDLQGAVVNLAGTPLANSKAKVVKNAVLALADIYLGARQERKGTERQTQWGRLWQEFQEVGGMTGFRDQFRNSGDRARAIERTMNPEKWMESAFGKVVTAGGLLKTPMTWVQDGGGWVLDLLSDYNLAMENGVRLAAYKEGLDKGLTQEQAASLAKNITVNFNRRGSIGLHVGSAYAFFNAAMQGTARMGQAMTTMEDGKLSTLRLSALGKQVVAGGLAMGVAQAVALSMAGFGEDEPPQFVREKNLVIPTGWTGIGSEKGYLTVPMPLGLHVIPGLGRHLTEFAMSGGKNPAERVTLIMGMLLDAFNPIGNAGWSLQTIVPTVLDPLAALAENKDYTGRNIAIESRNPNAPGHTLARDTASTFSKLLSEAINTLTGGNEYVSGVMSPTPDQIDYLIGQVTGGVGREALKVEQTVRGAVTGEEVPLYKIPLVGRFAGDSDGSGGQATIYRANVNRLDRAQMEIDGLRKDGRFQESEALRQRSNPYLLAQARAAESQVQRLRRMKRDMVEKGASRESVREVERKISEAMGRLNRAVEAQQR